MEFSHMNITKPLVLAFITSFTIQGAVATAAPLDDVSAYFNELETLQTRFTQYNADGTLSHGTLYLKRPGKLRMEYDADGDGALLVVGAGSVAIYDAKSDQKAARYPLSKTPLGPILARHVDLKSDKMVDGADEHEKGISVFASDPDHPEYGVGRFGFDKAPLRLVSWTMTNEFGETTHIVFEGGSKVGHDISNQLFSISSEDERRNPNGR